MRPLEHLNTASKIFPSAWKQVESMLEGKGKDLPVWPEWCFLPMAAWYAIVSGGGDNRLGIDEIRNVGQLAAIGTWRYSQGIYRFDPDLLAALAKTELEGDIPADVVMRLPEWSIYIETSGMKWSGSELYGFWAHLESDANDGRVELRLLLDMEESLIPFPIHIGKWSLREAVSRALNVAAAQGVVMGNPILRDSQIDSEITQSLQPLIALVLYLCSDEPEIDNDREPGSSPYRAVPRKVKGGVRWYAPDRPRIWEIGRAIGHKLRKEVLGCQRDGVKAHLRRAHWHGFWLGPKAGERTFRYHWLPQIVVGNKNTEEKLGV